MHWRVELLGELQVTCGEQVVRHFESRKVVALLARLALQPQRLHMREELAELLWPESDRETGLARLRHALSSLRRTLVPADLAGEGFFTADRQSIRVHSQALSCDVQAFERALAQAHWQEAQELYKGELLPGFYDDWLCDERTRLEALAARLPASPAPVVAAPPVVTAVPQPYLPAYLTRFYGRESECARLRELLVDCPLLTLLGPGGIGKTRLATELARELAPHYDTTAFVPLAECRDASQILDRVRVALGVTGGEGSTQEQLRAFFQERRCLLVLDNVEQLVESGAAEALEALFATSLHLTCLVTSRQVLGVPGEQLFPLAPLPPSASHALFLDRARAARPDFTLTERNQEALEGLCKKLEGMPLALELAASRIRSVSLSEMRSQLDQSLRLLARPSGVGQKAARHGSLHAAISWSWRILSPSQQSFLAQLSVFCEGWSAAAATDVCALTDAPDRLAALVDASLVLCEETANGTTRFRLLELLRTFAAEQLPESQRLVTQAHHRAYFAQFATSDDTANVRAALESACDTRDSAAAYALFAHQATGALAPLGASQTLQLGQQVLGLPPPALEVRLQVLGHTVAFADTSGETALARRLAQKALREAGATPRLRALALAIQGQLAVSNYTKPERALPPLREALTLATQEGDTSTQATVLRRLGILLLRSKQLDEAATCFKESEHLFTLLHDATGARYALANRAHVLGEQGDSEGSLALYQRCLVQANIASDLTHQSKLLLNIGSLQAALGQWEAALQTGQDCLRICQAIGNLRTLAFAFWNLPEPLLQRGFANTAVLLMAFAEGFWRVRFGFLTPDDLLYKERLYAEAKATEAQRTQGLQLTLSEALDRALHPSVDSTRLPHA